MHFNAMVIDKIQNKLADHVQHLRNDLKIAKDDSMEGSGIRGLVDEKREVPVNYEIHPTFFKTSNELLNISLADPIMAEYSDAEWEAMHQELLTHVQNIVWENIEERSIFYRIREYLNMRHSTDTYAYDEITNDKSQTYWRSKTTGGQAFYYERLSPEEEIVYPTASAKKLYFRQLCSVLSWASLVTFLKWCRRCVVSLHKIVWFTLRRKSVNTSMIYEGPSLDVKDDEIDAFQES